MTHGGVTECPRLIYPFSVIPLLEYLGYLEYFSAVGFYWSFFFFMADDTESAWIAPYLSDERNKWDNHSPKLYSLHSPTDTRIWVDPLLLIRLSSVPSLRFIFLPASLLQETCLSRCEAQEVWETWRWSWESMGNESCTKVVINLVEVLNAEAKVPISKKLCIPNRNCWKILGPAFCP